MKFIDSIDEIHKNTSGEVYRIEIAEILQYLDDHPELTGKAITESELVEVARTHESIRHLVEMLGITITPDPEPEPKNLQLLSQAIRDWEEGRGADRILARHLDAKGVKAPGGDDE